MRKLPISAIVVSCNEGHLLDGCLASIAFADEILVVDLESTDDTAAIAARHGCALWRRPRVPIVEQVHAEARERVRHDWLLLLDPDQRVDPALARQLVAEFASYVEPTLAIVSAPMLYYFGRRQLAGTIWGGVHEWYLLLRRDAVDFTGAVHRGVVCHPGRRVNFLARQGDNVVHHYWSTGWRELFAKHRRYLEQEGAARHAAGERFAWRQLFAEGPRRFRESFVEREGRRDGRLGVALSLFWAWYSIGALLSLRRFERRAARG